MEQIKALYIKPNKLPEVVNIDNNLKTFQKMVDGHIECAYLMDDDEVVLICNEEGKIRGMEFNRDIGHDIIAGPFLIVKDDGNDFGSLTEEQLKKYNERFNWRSIADTDRKIFSIIMNSKLKKNMEMER